MSDKARFLAWNLGMPLAVACATFVLFDLTSLDELISNALYYPAHAFPFAHDRLFENITHRWARVIPNWTGAAAIIGLLLSFIWPMLQARSEGRGVGRLERWGIARWLRTALLYRKDFLFITVALAVTTGAIHFLKSHTGVFCPVETTLYGGLHDRKEWFENFSLLHTAGAGRCWPGGHASGGFAMVALYFVACRHRWPHARMVLFASLALGALYGTTRVLQGWHFMSHTLWSGIIVWLGALLTALAFYGWQALALPARDPMLQVDRNRSARTT